MKLDKKHIGRRAKLIEKYSSLDVESEVIIRDVDNGYGNVYTCEIIEDKAIWLSGGIPHDCNGFFNTKSIGYFVGSYALDLIEEEIIKDDFEIPSGL